jgi:hypothetical protein
MLSRQKRILKRAVDTELAKNEEEKASPIQVFISIF